MAALCAMSPLCGADPASVSSKHDPQTQGCPLHYIIFDETRLDIRIMTLIVLLH